MRGRNPTGSWMLLALLAVGCGVARPAHAGMFEAIDRMFTFREDQKPRVAPRRALPPKEVVVPSYNEQDHAAWSDYYTRSDLTPQDYLAGSGSKVMRAPVQERPTLHDRPPLMGAHTVTVEEDIRIGEPIDNTPAQGEVGRATQIGEPVQDWQATNRRNGMSSRPGDYDYRAPLRQSGEDDGDVIAGRRADEAAQDELARHARDARDVARVTIKQRDLRRDPRYAKFNSAGQVTRYRVQHEDTLTSIAGQQAIYDNWKLWPLIYSANRKAIGHDPDNLHYQQILGIPRNYTKVQAREAEKKAMLREPGRAGDGR